MAWVVDTCVLLDLLADDPAFSPLAVACLRRCSMDDLIISPITYVELTPAFRGDGGKQLAFLSGKRIRAAMDWSAADTQEAARLWTSHVANKRLGLTRKRPVTDVLIAAFASRHQGLITPNVRDFRSLAPSLNLIDPTTFS